MLNLYRPKFSYIIPFRYRPDRIIPLRRVLDWLSGFQGIEVIVVEQDKNSKLQNLNLKCLHIFVESEAPFNKSWSYNIAIKRASSNILVFADGDFIMNPNDMIESLRTLEFFDCVIPTSNNVKLQQNESNADFMNIFNIQRTQSKLSMSDGISIYKKEAIQKVGGWNEDLLGLGFPNTFQDLKIKKMLNYKQLDFTGFQFYHSSEKQDFQILQRNQQILEHYNKPGADLNSHVMVTIPKIGLANKFQI